MPTKIIIEAIRPGIGSRTTSAHRKMKTTSMSKATKSSA